mmetsp:Transcript_36103/g.69216  ORF Transcript_36103/g.69216 Transcript_36103/m.69216 type:complete len:244 (-) Transcript_36103:1873-2604(-)
MHMHCRNFAYISSPPIVPRHLSLRLSEQSVVSCGFFGQCVRLHARLLSAVAPIRIRRPHRSSGSSENRHGRRNHRIIVLGASNTGQKRCNYNKQHLPLFASPMPVFPNTITDLHVEDPASIIKLNSIVAGHRRFAIAYQDPSTGLIAKTGCLAQVQPRRCAAFAGAEDYNSVVTIRVERRLRILSAENDITQPHLHARVDEGGDDEDATCHSALKMSTGGAEQALAQDILHSLKQLSVMHSEG